MKVCNWKVLQGNSLDLLKSMESGSVNCCVTSPPYYGLRDYGTGVWTGGDPKCSHMRENKLGSNCTTGHSNLTDMGGAGDSTYLKVCKRCGAVREDLQVGLEETPELYIERLVGVFREVRRVLKDNGTLWVNIGDSYSRGDRGSVPSQFGDCSTDSDGKKYNFDSASGHLGSHPTIKSKDLIGIPWMLAFALRADGWYLRQDIIWSKPNPMPESVKDRCTKAHEYVFLLSKSDRYFFDYEKIKEPAVSGVPSDSRNRRSVWAVPVRSYREAHFATYPTELITPCIQSGCPSGGTVLDPFNGSGTTGEVAMRNGCNYVGLELNPEYIKIAENRLTKCEESIRMAPNKLF